jgi:uncharacterized protein YecA (UPF0149 family)
MLDGLGLSLNGLCAVALRDYLDARKKLPELIPAAPEQARPGVSVKAEPGLSSCAGTQAQGLSGSVRETVEREAPCPCGSGQKWKRCHGKK